jgi:hypothetical protein
MKASRHHPDATAVSTKFIVKKIEARQLGLGPI